MDQKQHLLTLSEALAAHHGVKHFTISMRALGKGDFFQKLMKPGADCRTRTAARLHGRMLDWVQAEPGEARDVVHLAKIYCRGVELDNEMMARILAESRASIRRICVNLDRVREWAVTRNMTRVTAKDWGGGAFVSGEAPAPRRAVA